jgi:adenosylcobyric acid synthase
MTRTVMLQGTGSDVGKTVLVAGLCRLARLKGMVVRPFKPQNMSNNAAVSDDGGEIGRAQWLQALACGVPSTVHMNPVLLKPQSEVGSQIIVQGKVFGHAKGRDYQRLKPQLLSSVLQSFEEVKAGADLVIVEGAGSPAEINLRAGDIANMGFATRANVPVVLVGDIDRGGVIASLVGTHAILSDDDRAMISGYIINKFRGDQSLFNDGILAIDGFTGWNCFGVVPWLKAAHRLPSEDSVALERLTRKADGALKIVIPVLSRIANFDDFDPIAAEPSVELCYVRAGERLPADAALVILPGSKSTIGDLADLRSHGWDQDLLLHRRRGGRIIGICGGYQMLGNSVSDPLGLEGAPQRVAGLALLDIDTEMEPEKTVRNSMAHALEYDVALSGYEIHLGRTTGPDCQRPALTIHGREEGAISADGRVMGTYLHGLFANDAYRAALLRSFGVMDTTENYRDSVERALDDVAMELETVLDRDWIDQLMG